jgi:hypothetical protein
MLCPVVIRLKLRNNAYLEVVSVSDINEHNHPLSEALYSFYSEARRLSTEEKAFATEMLLANIAPRVIATAINTNRNAIDKKGVVLPKDIMNLAGQLNLQKTRVKKEPKSVEMSNHFVANAADSNEQITIDVFHFET